MRPGEVKRNTLTRVREIIIYHLDCPTRQNKKTYPGKNKNKEKEDKGNSDSLHLAPFFFFFFEQGNKAVEKKD